MNPDFKNHFRRGSGTSSALGRLPTGLRKFLRWAQIPWRAQGPTPEATGRLNDAIRANDLAAVQEALNDGAPIASCTLDNDGYHTPYELALRFCGPEIIALLSQERPSEPT